MPDLDAPRPFDLYVRGQIPAALSGALIVATSRRSKSRLCFSRWHDSPTDLIRLDLMPGRPGRIRARVLEIGPNPVGGARGSVTHVRAQPSLMQACGAGEHPNHALNALGDVAWATNLLFGAPVEIELQRWQPRRVVQVVEVEPGVRLSTTSHFGCGLDGRHVYFHQSLLVPSRRGRPVKAADLRMVELDTRTGDTRSWELVPPRGDSEPESANFHSAFCFEHDGSRYVGLLRTGAVIEHLHPHEGCSDHDVTPMSPSSIWIVRIEPRAARLQAKLLPGIRELDGLALSHLAVETPESGGFVLYANYKEADVAEETHGLNVYGERPEDVAEHYSGMTVEPLNYGRVIRYAWQGECASLISFARPYDPARTSLGHTWLPINLRLSRRRQWLFASFGGLRPRLLSRHIARAYPERAARFASIGHIPPLLMRLQAETLAPDGEGDGDHLSYAEPMAFELVGDERGEFVCTFAPELGLRIYQADNLGQLICHAYSPDLLTWRDSHFRTEPAHMQFISA